MTTTAIIEKDILKVIKNGYHRVSEILVAAGLELRYQDFCEAIGNLQIKKKVECRDGGYYLIKKEKAIKAIYKAIFGASGVMKFEKSSKEELERFKQDIKELKKQDYVKMELDIDKDKVIAGGTNELIEVFVITDSDPNKELTKGTCALNLNALYKTLNYVLE